MNNECCQVTIIVCCYNAEKYIQITLNSLLKQTYSNINILVIDDGSVDASISIVASIAKTDSRIKVLKNKCNRGTAFTRMRGLKSAESDYVMFFDADDIAKPDLIQKLFGKIMSDKELMGVSSYASYFSDSEDIGIQSVGPVTKNDFFDLYKSRKMIFILPITLFDRKAALSVGGYRTNIMPNPSGIRYEDFSEDVDLWCRMSDLAADGRYFVTIPEPLFRYRKPVGSLSTRNVGLMQLKMRWIKDCLIRRRSGLAERSLADFIASRSLLQRLNDQREDLAAGFYKRAGFAYSSRNFIGLAFYLALAGAFSPKLIRQKIRTQTARTGVSGG